MTEATSPPGIRRRQAAGLIAAALAWPASAAPRRPPVLVNLADPAPTADLAAGADAARRMTAPVFINGEGPFAFVVDSGANRSVVADELAQDLDLPRAAAVKVHGIAGVEPAPTFRVDRLAIGGAVNRRLRLPALPRGRMGADGLLGVDVMRNRRVRLDFTGNRFSISGPGGGFDVLAGSGSRLDAASGGEVVVPARFRFGQLIIVDADMAGLPVTCFLDSGSQNTVGNLALKRALNVRRPELGTGRVVVQLVSATGQTASGEEGPTPGLRLGGLRIGNLSAVFADLHVFDLWDLLDAPAMLIGVDVMRHFATIDLDFAERRVIFRSGAARTRPLVGGAG